MTWLIYALAALAEIAGCFAFWAWIRLDRSPLWLLPGICVVGPLCVPANSGRERGRWPSVRGLRRHLHCRLDPLALAGRASDAGPVGSHRLDGVPCGRCDHSRWPASDLTV